MLELSLEEHQLISLLRESKDEFRMIIERLGQQGPWTISVEQLGSAQLTPFAANGAT
jgi:hypothetical protein